MPAIVSEIISIKNRHIGVFKYLVSGGTAFIVEYITFILIFYVFQATNIAYANAASYVLGFVVSFSLNRSWVFSVHSYKHSLKKQILLYLSIGLLNLLFSTLAVSILSKEIPGYLAKIVSVILIAAWNYVIYKKVLFREKHQ